METEAANRSSAADQAGGGATGTAPPQVDLAQLAERVYRLLREELRLDRLRGAADASRGRR